MKSKNQPEQIVAVGAVLLLFSLLLIAQNVKADTGQLPEPAAVSRGLELYEAHCIACHKAGGVGENVPLGIRAPGFQPAIPLNESSHAWHHGDEQLAQIIARGNKRMPPFERVLTRAQIEDVVAYMKSLWSHRILACQGPRHMQCL